ncbi:diguanylate cyclase [Sphingomonas sp. NBWT7]|nr:diguanylate cyclase [Sphingomonas sp. NBWT7]
MVAQLGEPLCCIAVDIGRFKGIDDRWSHQFGDTVLQHLADVLRAHTRPVLCWHDWAGTSS